MGRLIKGGFVHEEPGVKSEGRKRAHLWKRRERAPAVEGHGPSLPWMERFSS